MACGGDPWCKQPQTEAQPPACEVWGFPLALAGVDVRGCPFWGGLSACLHPEALLLPGGSGCQTSSSRGHPPPGSGCSLPGSQAPSPGPWTVCPLQPQRAWQKVAGHGRMWGVVSHHLG